MKYLNKFYKCVTLFAFIMLLVQCVAVKPYEREYLADPTMSTQNHLTKQTLEDKFFSTREGSIGGAGGIGGGCGCAK